MKTWTLILWKWHGTRHAVSKNRPLLEHIFHHCISWYILHSGCQVFTHHSVSSKTHSTQETVKELHAGVSKKWMHLHVYIYNIKLDIMWVKLSMRAAHLRSSRSSRNCLSPTSNRIPGTSDAVAPALQEPCTSAASCRTVWVKHAETTSWSAMFEPLIVGMPGMLIAKRFLLLKKGSLNLIPALAPGGESGDKIDKGFPELHTLMIWQNWNMLWTENEANEAKVRGPQTSPIMGFG